MRFRGLREVGMHETILNSGWDTFLVAAPFITLLAMSIFHLDEAFLGSKTGPRAAPGGRNGFQRRPDLVRSGWTPVVEAEGGKVTELVHEMAGEQRLALWKALETGLIVPRQIGSPTDKLFKNKQLMSS